MDKKKFIDYMEAKLELVQEEMEQSLIDIHNRHKKYRFVIYPLNVFFIAVGIFAWFAYTTRIDEVFARFAIGTVLAYGATTLVLKTVDIFQDDMRTQRDYNKLMKKREERLAKEKLSTEKTEEQKLNVN